MVMAVVARVNLRCAGSGGCWADPFMVHGADEVRRVRSQAVVMVHQALDRAESKGEDHETGENVPRHRESPLGFAMRNAVHNGLMIMNSR